MIGTDLAARSSARHGGPRARGARVAAAPPAGSPRQTRPHARPTLLRYSAGRRARRARRAAPHAAALRGAARADAGLVFSPASHGLGDHLAALACRGAKRDPGRLSSEPRTGVRHNTHAARGAAPRARNQADARYATQEDVSFSRSPRIQTSEYRSAASSSR
ncbi:MAG: hypothetical protein WKG07_36065 [Hymenobacter sp.]